MALFYRFDPARRDKILPGWKPIAQYHSNAGWTCARDGHIGYGETLESAWYDWCARLLA